MTASRFLASLLAVYLLVQGIAAKAEDYEEPSSDTTESRTSDEESDERPARPAKPSKRARDKERRKYMIYDTERVDAGVFHVGFAVGGNFYVEPEVSSATKAPTGNYFKDFGFQGGVYFDFDYSALEENIPLALRGFLGYKYILSSTHVFAFDGVVRRMFRFSEKATFGVGFGGSAAVWYRAASVGPPAATEELIFLPSLLLTAGFEFNPVMVDFKWLINKFGEDATITGIELYFGIRL